LYKPNPEIERTFRLKRKKQRIEDKRREARKNSNMVEGGQLGTLQDFVTPGLQGIASSIARLVIDANKFELTPALFSMVQQSQFSGTPLGCTSRSFRGV